MAPRQALDAVDDLLRDRDHAKQQPVLEKNSDALRINNEILHKLPGEAVKFKSIAEAITESPSDALNFPTEFLNKMPPNGLPSQELHLIVGAIIMLHIFEIFGIDCQN